MYKSLFVSSLCAASVHSFAFIKEGRSSTALQMGLFDGVKDAFVAPALERSAIDAERETPIDRWMGWSVVSDNQETAASAGKLTPRFTFSR